MENDLEILKEYDYEYPKELIAQKPVSPRDAARLLVYNRNLAVKPLSHDIFRNLPKYLPKGAVLVFNQTKVIPARFEATKPTGGKVTLFYIEHGKNFIKVLSDRRISVGSKISRARQSFIVDHQKDQFYFLRKTMSDQRFMNFLNKFGKAPTPPYIKRQGTRREYQTIFAKHLGAVAAPTASLHFTKALMQKINHKEFVTLHVGLGTFAPLTEKQLKTGKLHEEKYEISKATWQRILKAKKAGKKIIAVGTTSLRALESYLEVRPLSSKSRGLTSLFIRPGYRFKVVDGLITNFHVPRSSLMMLVAALVGREKLLELYREAIENQYRLFSFGDGMLIL